MTPAARLLRWYGRFGRNLPWRKTRDPYRILVSEIMLQQTQVERVLIFYKRWLALFPSWSMIAKATDAEAIRAWAGLGYNRRALMLKKAAIWITRRALPKTEDEWSQIKGIGPYTAAAMMAFAHRQRTFPIDTVIRRVAGRLLLGTPFPQPKQDDRLWRAAHAFLPTRGRFYDVPQALFDLGSAVCKKSPLCISCPLRSDCKVAGRFLSGHVRIPKAMVQKSKETRHANKPFPDRIYRGRILKAVRERHQSIAVRDLGKIVDPDFLTEKDRVWISAMVTRLQQDGLVTVQRDRISLP